MSVYYIVICRPVLPVGFIGNAVNGPAKILKDKNSQRSE